MVGYAVVGEEKFKSWRKHYDKARTDIVEIEKRKNGEHNDIGAMT